MDFQIPIFSDWRFGLAAFSPLGSYLFRIVIYNFFRGSGNGIYSFEYAKYFRYIGWDIANASVGLLSFALVNPASRLSSPLSTDSGLVKIVLFLLTFIVLYGSCVYLRFIRLSVGVDNWRGYWVDTSLLWMIGSILCEYSVVLASDRNKGQPFLDAMIAKENYFVIGSFCSVLVLVLFLRGLILVSSRLSMGLRTTKVIWGLFKLALRFEKIERVSQRITFFLRDVESVAAVLDCSANEQRCVNSLRYISTRPLPMSFKAALFRSIIDCTDCSENSRAVAREALVA